MDPSSFIQWAPSPELISIGSFSMRWYGFLFSFGFFLGYLFILRVYSLEKKPEEDASSLLTTMVVGTLIGARLGHCLFYEPAYYLSNPLRILMVWQGGLASHGAAIGILSAVFLFSRKRLKTGQTFLWVMDRIAMATAIATGFIRAGNLMNSEIIGLPTTVPWAFVFTRIDSVPRHPTQIYEGVWCWVVFVILYLIYRKRTKDTPQGLLIGWFFVLIFGFRMWIERFKENQVPFEDGMILNMGQILSIPIVLLGMSLILYSRGLLNLRPRQR